jgi:hypothetical protein
MSTESHFVFFFPLAIPLGPQGFFLPPLFFKLGLDLLGNVGQVFVLLLLRSPISRMTQSVTGSAPPFAVPPGDVRVALTAAYWHRQEGQRD